MHSNYSEMVLIQKSILRFVGILYKYRKRGSKE